METNLLDVEKVIVLDFGSQYSRLITRRIREQGVFSELLPHDTSAQEIFEMGNVIGIVLSGGPTSVFDINSLSIDPGILALNLPVLGISYGMQLISHLLGGKLLPAKDKEFGQIEIELFKTETGIFEDLTAIQKVMMSRGDLIEEAPEGFEVTARSESALIMAFESLERKIYGVQFHPEVRFTESGITILHNFIYDVCEAKGDWSMENFIDIEIDKIRQEVGDKKVLLGLSGGVDSSVVGVLLQKAIGEQLVCIFVDHGLLRKNEGLHVMNSLKQFGLNIIHIDAKDRFFDKLKGVSDPEEKRKIIGNEFIYVFDDEADKLDGIEYLAQGTLYTDIIESGTATSQTIKSHHNVGGLPEDMNFKLIEPLKSLFKDEVRELGTTLGMPDSIVWRQPFPGPGLGIRVLGEITEEKVEIVRESDAILREEIKNYDLERDVWQYFTTLPNVQTVGVSGDSRTYDHMVGIRAVTSVDGMTSEFARIDWEVLHSIANRILNEVPHVNRIVYDITDKPPGTIEWE